MRHLAQKLFIVIFLAGASLSYGQFDPIGLAQVEVTPGKRSFTMKLSGLQNPDSFAVLFENVNNQPHPHTRGELINAGESYTFDYILDSSLRRVPLGPSHGYTCYAWLYDAAGDSVLKWIEFDAWTLPDPVVPVVESVGEQLTVFVEPLDNPPNTVEYFLWTSSGDSSGWLAQAPIIENGIPVGYATITWETALADTVFAKARNPVGAEIEVTWITPVVSHVGESWNIVPSNFVLHQNYPNPFNPSTTISFELLNTAHVVVEVYNLNGQLIETLFKGKKGAGRHELVWEAGSVSSGVYILSLRGSNIVQTQKMTLLR